jgi:ADP-heptose:LPS heptosyltransferase
VNVDLMRWVDYWVGVPLCFLFSVVHGIARFLGFRRPVPGARPKKILFIELSEMGSTILAYGAMKRAQELFQADLHFMIFHENRESVELLGIVPPENLITIRSRSLSHLATDTVRAIRRMRAQQIDTVIDLELFSRFTSLLCVLSPARRVVGFHRYHMEGLYRGSFQTHRVSYNPYLHMTQNFLSLVHALTAADGESPLLKKRVLRDEAVLLKVESTPAERAAMLGKLVALNPRVKPGDRILLLNPGASKLLPIRKWPIENYIALARRILSTTQAYVAVIGLASDREDAAAIARAVQDDRLIDFTGKTANLRELVTLFQVASAMVTNDSGPAHFAALTNLRTVVLFGPETPALYGPAGANCHCLYAHLACSPCVSAYNHRKTSCRDNVCLKSIPLDAVYELVAGELQG